MPRTCSQKRFILDKIYKIESNHSKKHTSRGLLTRETCAIYLLVESRIGKVDVFLIHTLFGKFNGFAYTINMKQTQKSRQRALFNA